MKGKNIVARVVREAAYKWELATNCSRRTIQRVTWEKFPDIPVPHLIYARRCHF
ncbi:hypothetical protein ABMH43_002361 [Escherichia coli]